MKTNLDSLFKTSEKHEQEGVWLQLTDKIAFKVKRFGGMNSPKVKAALAKYYKPYARMIEMDTMPEKEQKKIMIKVFVESSLLDWEGIEIDGVVTAYSTEKAVELFMQLPEVFDTIFKYASEFENFKEDLGNS